MFTETLNNKMVNNRNFFKSGMALAPKHKAIRTCFIYGFFFYKKPANWKNAIGSAVAVTLIVNLCLTFLWLSIMYHQTI